MSIKKIICAGLVAMAIPVGMYVVDSSSADVLKCQAKTVVAEAAVQIDMQTAKEIALNHAGFTEDQVIFKKIKLDREHGQYVYEIEFKVGYVEYEYDISASNGAILSFEQDMDLM